MIYIFLGIMFFFEVGGGGFFNVFCFFPQIALAFWGFLLTIGRGGGHQLWRT